MRILNAVALFLAFNSNGQEPVLVFEDTVMESSMIKLSSFNTYSSNKFSNEYMDKFLFGGEITTELKDKTSGKLGRRNVLGAEFEQRLDVYLPSVNLFKKEDYGMVLSLSDNHYASANIPTDLFNTAMYGNSPYVGDTMSFAFSAFQYQHYQKIGFGFFHQANMSSIQISYVTGSKTAKGALNDSYLFTHANEDTINIAASGEMFMTESFSPYWAFQGHGFAIDVNYNFIFQGKVKNRQVINFRLNNLGMLFWNKGSKGYVINTDANYTGFDIQDLLNQDTTQTSTIDWMDTLNVTESTGSVVDVLPIELVVQKLPDHGIDAKWQPIFGFKAIMVPEYFPYLYGGVYYKPSDNFSVSSRVSYGGFAGLRWGLNFNYWVQDKMYFALGTYDMIGLVSKSIGFGRGANFTMYLKF